MASIVLGRQKTIDHFKTEYNNTHDVIQWFNCDKL